jgi:PAS domain S-box-containing protein
MQPSSDRPATGLEPGQGGKPFENLSGKLRHLPRLLIISFVLLATAVTGFIWHDLRRARADTVGHWKVLLSNAADEQVRVITLWLGERQSDAEQIAENPITISLLADAEVGQKKAEFHTRVRQDLDRITRTNHLLAATIVDTYCQVAAGASRWEEFAGDFQAACKWVFQTGGFEVITSGWEEGRIQLNLAVPVFDDRGSGHSGPVSRKALGAVLLVSDPWKALLPFLAPGSEAVGTSETLLVWKGHEEAVIFAPSWKVQGEISLFRRSLNDESLEAHVAREGRVDFGEFIDHQGVPVFGVGRRIPIAGDNLVRKVARDQALSDYQRRATLEVLVGALSVLLLGFVLLTEHRQVATSELKEKVRQQQALLELRQHADASEARYRSLFERNLAGVFRTTLDGQILDYNPAIVKIFGYPEVETESPKAQNLYFNVVDRQDLLDLLIQERSVTNHEIRMRRRDGTPTWVLLNAHLVEGGTGEPQVIEGTVFDITERKRLEDELRQAQKMEAIGRLAGGVAHDFNNLLTAILGYSHLILGMLRQENPLRANVEEIHKAAQRASALTEQLLTFGRKQVPQPKVLDLNTLITNSTRMLSRLIGEDIELSVELDPNLVPIKADPNQIEQVLLNLAVNARDAMPQGGRLYITTTKLDAAAADTLRSAVTHSGPWILVGVRDTGCGMDADVRSHLFEPFFTTKEAGKGTGLGLPTVYGIVGQSGGDIWVDSQPGQGTTFWILLPGVNAPVSKEEPTVPLSTWSGSGTETVLVVEDEEVVREFACRVLRLNGYQVLEASTGGQAVLLSERHPGEIHLMLTDVIMPQMSGPELASLLAGARPQMKVLYMSGYTGDAMVHNGLKTGVDLIPKPFGPTALTHKVRELLDGLG